MASQRFTTSSRNETHELTSTNTNAVHEMTTTLSRAKHSDRRRLTNVVLSVRQKNVRFRDMVALISIHGRANESLAMMEEDIIVSCIRNLQVSLLKGEVFFFFFFFR